jgi:hypothetical protein
MQHPYGFVAALCAADATTTPAAHLLLLLMLRHMGPQV